MATSYFGKRLITAYMTSNLLFDIDPPPTFKSTIHKEPFPRQEY
jgi:hypothetical protein